MEKDNDPFSWRNAIAPQLEDLGIIVLNPLIKPTWLPKMSGSDQDNLRESLTKGVPLNGNVLSAIHVNDSTREYCLALARMSDFIIAKINKNVFSVGIFEEITKNIEKPILVISDDLIPSMWLYSQLGRHSVFYKTIDEVVKILKEIDSWNNKSTPFPFDNCRWIFATHLL